ncbi:putative leucine-rich repeat domain, L domain-containing protein [Rosa chinensis]|uniref:Putative leucine-rich repeat domain, L domain-containing protein n=2 Tax=Rosa chinensis TaxID=74649 RepID=A0A2P6S8T6_ROSCH|nr:putative leucine-rich repeat domain, L domain-containing protein [Rosa chinensis]
MTPQLSQLTNLQTLSNFVVGKGNVSRVGEIGPLSLRWTLCLKRLENVTNVEDATRANLLSKQGLDALQLEWSGTDGKESEVLDVLKPHINLKELIIKGYNGLEFTTWIQHPLFSEMTLVVLENCKKCRFLPALGQLHSLKQLFIKGMSTVESVGPEFYGKAEGLPFPVLETLEFKNMEDWKEWFPWEQSQGNGVFPCLKMLSISTCPKLKGSLPKNIHLLSKLVIDGCEQLVVSTTNYKLIHELNICGCKWVVDRSGVKFELLEAMHGAFKYFRVQI